jgi:hypothetical protein
VGTGLPVLISLETGLRADPELQASLHPFPLQSLGQEVPPSHASPRAPGAVSWSRHRGRLTFLGPIDDEPLAHLPHSADLETIVIAPATGYLIGVDNTGNVFRERIEMDLLGARN